MSAFEKKQDASSEKKCAEKGEGEGWRLKPCLTCGTLFPCNQLAPDYFCPCVQCSTCPHCGVWNFYED